MVLLGVRCEGCGSADIAALRQEMKRTAVRCFSSAPAARIEHGASSASRSIRMSPRRNSAVSAAPEVVAQLHERIDALERLVEMLQRERRDIERDAARRAIDALPDCAAEAMAARAGGRVASGGSRR